MDNREKPSSSNVQESARVSRNVVRRNAILFGIHKKQEELKVGSNVIFNVAPSGLICVNGLTDSEDVPSSEVEKNEAVGPGENRDSSLAKNATDSLSRDLTNKNGAQERMGNWFKIIEKAVEESLMVSKENFPRSALKFIDEALEFELGGLIEKGVLGMDGMDEGGQNIITRAVLDVEPEEELNEV